jgi:uncharacterized phiE125 gp8 family phage protein
VTLDDLKSQVHITHDVQNATLTAYLEMATKYAEDYQRKSYINQQWELTLDCIPVAPLKLLRGPVTQLLSVKVYDSENNETDVDLSNFYLETSHHPAKLILTEDGEWPSVTLRSVGGVKITYSTGYGVDGTNVPSEVKHAIKLFAAFADDNRAADEMDLPRAFWDLLRPTRIDTNEPW